MPSFWGPRKENFLNSQQVATEAAAAAQKEQRKEVLKWTSDALALEINSIKRVQNGAVFCQLFHILHADAIDMSSVNFAAQSEFECLANYRILQRGHSEMTKLKLLEWWRLIADEERAWELLTAMRTAVIDSGKLEAYSPLETKHESKGAHLHAPLIPDTIESPSLPSNGVSRLSMTRSGSLKNSPHSFVPGGTSSFTSAPASHNSALKAHPNAVQLPMPLSPRSPRTPLEAPISPSTGSESASPAGKEALAKGSNKKGSESAAAGEDHDGSKGAAAEEGMEQADQDVSARQNSFLRAGSWKFNWPSKKAMVSPEDAVNRDEKALKDDILPMKLEPAKVDVKVAKNTAAAPESPIADCRAAASAPFVALGSLLRRNNAANNIRAGQPVTAPLESQLSSVGMEQNGRAGSLGVPPNLMNASFVGEPPEEPAYALERVTSFNPDKDAGFRKEAHGAAEQIQPKKDPFASLERFSDLATYKLRHVQPLMFDHSGALEPSELSLADPKDGPNPLHTAPAALSLTPSKRIQAKESDAGPITAGIGLKQEKLRGDGLDQASTSPEMPQKFPGKAPTKKPDTGSVAAQNELSQMKLRQVGDNKAEGAAAGGSEAPQAALPAQSLQSTPHKDDIPLGQARLRSSVAKEAASPDCRVDDQARTPMHHHELSQEKPWPAEADPASPAAQQEALPREATGTAGQEDHDTPSKPEEVSLEHSGAKMKGSEGKAEPAVSPSAAEADHGGRSRPEVPAANAPEKPKQGMLSQVHLRSAEPRDTKPSVGESEGFTFDRVKLRRIESKRGGAGAAGEQATRDLIFDQSKLRRVESKKGRQSPPTPLRGTTQEESKAANVQSDAHPNQSSSSSKEADSDKHQDVQSEVHPSQSSSSKQADSGKPQAATKTSHFSLSRLKSRKAEPAASPADEDAPKEGIFSLSKPKSRKVEPAAAPTDEGEPKGRFLSQAMLRRTHSKQASTAVTLEAAGTSEEGKAPKHVPRKIMPVEYEEDKPTAAKAKEEGPGEGGPSSNKGCTETKQIRTGNGHAQGKGPDAHQDVLKKSSFSQAMLRRVQSRRSQPEAATEPDVSAEQPASRWGSTLKSVTPAEAKPAQEDERKPITPAGAKPAQENEQKSVTPAEAKPVQKNEQSDSQGKVMDVVQNSRTFVRPKRQKQSHHPSSTYFTQVNLKSTQPKAAQEEESKAAESTAVPFGVKLRRVESRKPAQEQALSQRPDGTVAPPTPTAVAPAEAMPAAAKEPEMATPEKAKDPEMATPGNAEEPGVATPGNAEEPEMATPEKAVAHQEEAPEELAAKEPTMATPEKAVAHQEEALEELVAEKSKAQADAPRQNGRFRRMESFQAKRSEPDATEISGDHNLLKAESSEPNPIVPASAEPAAEESQPQTDTPQQGSKFKRMESFQAKRSEPGPTEVSRDLPVEPSAPQASETAQGKDEATAPEAAASDGAGATGAGPAPSLPQPDACMTAGEITPPPPAAIVTEDEKDEVPRAKVTKQAKQHDILADTLVVERVASLPGAPKLFRGRKMWARAVNAALASKQDPSTPGGTKKWTDPLIKTPKSPKVAAEPPRAASLQRSLSRSLSRTLSRTLSRSSSQSKEASQSGEGPPGTPTAKKAGALNVSKSFKGRKMWAKGLSAIRKESEAAQQSQAPNAADQTAAKEAETVTEGVSAKEAPADKPKVKTWGTSFGAWGLALKKLGEDPQAAKRRIEEQAAKEEANRIAEEARAQSAHLIEAKLHNAEQLLGARGIRDKLEGIRGKYVQKSEGSSPSAASPPPPARKLSSRLTAGSLRQMSWNSRSSELSTPVLARRLSNASTNSGSGKVEDPRRAMRKKESWGEDWRAEDHISTLPEDNAEDTGPSAGASAFSAQSPDGTEDEKPKPLPAWLMRGVAPKQGLRKAAQESEVKTTEKPPTKVTDAGGPKPKVGGMLTGKANANAAPHAAPVSEPAAAPPTPPKEKEEEPAEPDSPKVDISAALAEQGAVTGKKGGIGKDAPAAWQKRPGASGDATPSASSSSTMQTAMQRAMQRRASLRKNEGGSGSAYQRIKSMPREHNLAVQSIINSSLEPTFEEQAAILAEPSQRDMGNDSPTPQVSLRDKFGPSGGPLSVRITEPTGDLQKSKSGRGAQVHMASLDQASSSVMEGLKKKNKLWIFGKGSGTAQAV